MRRTRASGYPQKAEDAADVSAKDYDLLNTLGGTSPDHMRRTAHMVKLARDSAKLGKAAGPLKRLRGSNVACG